MPDIPCNTAGSTGNFATTAGSLNDEMRHGVPDSSAVWREISRQVSQPTNSLAASRLRLPAFTVIPQPPSSTASGVAEKPMSPAMADFAGSNRVEKPPVHIQPCAACPAARAFSISGKSQVRIPGGLILPSRSDMKRTAFKAASELMLGLPAASKYLPPNAWNNAIHTHAVWMLFPAGMLKPYCLSWIILAPDCTTSSHVAGAPFGSSPAWARAFLFHTSIDASPMIGMAMYLSP